MKTKHDERFLMGSLLLKICEMERELNIEASNVDINTESNGTINMNIDFNVIDDHGSKRGGE